MFYTTLFRVIDTKIMLAYSCFIVIFLFSSFLSTCGDIWDSQPNFCEVDANWKFHFNPQNSASFNGFLVKMENHWLYNCDKILNFFEMG